jgi:hypothetical protein
VSAKSVTRQARVIGGQKRAVGTPLISLRLQICCVEERRSLQCASYRSKSEIPAYDSQVQPCYQK